MMTTTTTTMNVAPERGKQVAQAIEKRSGGDDTTRLSSLVTRREAPPSHRSKPRVPLH